MEVKIIVMNKENFMYFYGKDKHLDKIYLNIDNNFQFYNWIKTFRSI